MNNLNEGLIGIPPIMLDKIKKYIRKNMLWWARDRFKNKTREFPELFKEFKNIVKKYNVIIPPEKYKSSVDVIPVDLQGMGPKYEKFSPTVEKIYLYFDHKQTDTDTRAYWWPEHTAIIIHPMAIKYIKNYPSSRSHPIDIEIAINEIIASAEHELRHMVQYIILNQSEQIKKKEKYKDYGDDYFSSPIEFDPTIGSNVDEFMKNINILSRGKKSISPKNMALYVKQFVGAAPSSSFELFSVSPFFKALKKTSPVKYKIAVKKFITEIQNKLRNTQLSN